MAFVLASLSALAVDRKPVQLRNETIITAPVQRQALRPQAPEPPVSGLFVLQFESIPGAATRVELTRMGVRLLRYIPEDAFLARLDRARLDAIRDFPGVRWVGEYRPDHKIAASLRTLLAAGQGTDISVAFSPAATPAEIRRARGLLSRVDREVPLPFGSLLRGHLQPGQLAALARSPAVLWIERAPRFRLVDEIASKIVGGGPYDPGEAGECLPDLGDFGGGDDDEDFSLTGSPRRLAPQGLPSPPHLTMTQRLGFDGTGVTVAVADSGLHNGDAESMHPDLAGRVTAFFHYGTLPDASDENGHGTHVTGIVAGNGATGETDETGNLYGLGVAPAARIVAQRLFDGLGRESLPPTFEIMTRDAVRAGAEIGSNSWGEDTSEALGTTGAYDNTAAEFDALVRDADFLAAGDQPYILEFSAGNSGPASQTILTPAVAKNVIATGASQNHRYRLFCLYEDGPDAMADFSSRGPTQDGRIKPDLVAPGTWIASLQSASASPDGGWWPISGNYQYQGGTSQAGPHVSGAAAVFVQYWRETHGGVTPSPALVKAALINSATDMADEAGTQPVPNFDEGWGRITLTNLIGTTRSLDAVDQSVALATGQTYERRVAVGDPRSPLVVTLTYTDVPALPAALPALVNDLDLEVESPTGVLYRGNAFDRGESIPFAFARDTLNNVEGVRLAVPEPGEYTIRVRAVRVAEDIHGNRAGEPVQDFALVTSAIPPLPGAAIVSLDRPAYRAPDLIQIRLIDFDLRGQPGVDLTVRSATEPAGEIVHLTPRGSIGVFTGAVAVATGPATSDGQLQVTHGDALEVAYADASPAQVVRATAVADLVPPVLGGPRVTTRLARLQTEWDSDEPTAVIIEFGPTPQLGQALTNLVADTTHVFSLPGASAGQPIYFRLRARDLAGNESVLDDQGAPFRAVPERAATVLLVNTSTGGGGLFELGSLDAYLAALENSGVDHEVWDILDQGKLPTLEDLKPYRVVVWRPDELAIPDGGLVRALRDYVAAGGGLFVSSIEILSRLDEGGFQAFRRNVLQVDDYTVDVGVNDVFGLENISLTSGLELSLDYTYYEFLVLFGVEPSDTFQPAATGDPILFEATSGEVVGVRFPRTGADAVGRVVFLSFPLDSVSADAEEPNTPGTFLRRILGFLAPGSVDEGTLQLDRESYPVPGRVTIELASAGLAGQTNVTVTYLSDRAPTPANLDLDATPVPGLFRGVLTLAATNSPAATGVLPAADGDRLEVRRAPSANHPAIAVAAYVDTSAPEISNVTSEPDYTEAIVRWETSEFTEALVEFGETGFLNRTAYRGSLSDIHELRLSGLLPDRDYVFAVTSRDAAGNATRDNRGGQLYRFRTLKPLSPPFFDNLDGDASRWSVVDESLDVETLSLFTRSAWTLGVPANELAQAGHTGTQAWGTNLRGEGNDLASSWLVSPAITLSGGNRATLRFWHTYDFLPRSDDLDIAQAGGIYVTTDNGAAWASLKDYSEFSDGWEPEEIDLTPYLGQVVRIAWAYVLISLDPVVHPGWLVDDISVTVESFVPSRLIIRHNLNQGLVGIRGPLNRIERGLLTEITNAPPGEYRFDFGDVPYYRTPASITNTLDPAGLLTVEGVYTLADLNTNGIADPWEQQYFGAVRPDSPGTLDEDGDGASDLAEFLSGTNPTNALSRLAVRIVPGTNAAELELRWESGPGRSARVLGSANAADWTPESGWLRTLEGPNVVRVPRPSGQGEGRFYRLELQP